MDAASRDVWETVESLNRCWTEGDPRDLAGYFHEEMVAVTPADRLPVVGGGACVAAWSGYAQSVRILSWRTHDPRIRVFGDTAVVTYLFAMVCEQGGTRFEPTGRDMIVLIRENERWLVVADQFSSYPARGQA